MPSNQRRVSVRRTVQTKGVVFEPVLLRELSRSWAELNRIHFEGALRPPVLQLVSARRRLGFWQRTGRTLALSRPLVLERSWGMVLEVLRHEMAHQYVDEILGVLDETAHGPAFRRVCQERAIDARAAGEPRDSGTQETPAILRKIHALLALADSPNRHEAEAAMRAAHRMMRQYNVDAAPGRYGFRHLGSPTGRVPSHHRILAGILGEHFFVQPIWVFGWDPQRDARGRVLEICGRDENLAIASHVHDFVLATAERSWMAHRKTAGLRGNRERRTYLQGVMTGLYEQLQAQARACEETGLVWTGDADLQNYLARRHPRRVRGRARGSVVGPAWTAGRDAGRRLVLRRPVSAEASSRGRLLPG